MTDKIWHEIKVYILCKFTGDICQSKLWEQRDYSFKIAIFYKYGRKLAMQRSWQITRKINYVKRSLPIELWYTKNMLLSKSLLHTYDTIIYIIHY